MIQRSLQFIVVELLKTNGKLTLRDECKKLHDVYYGLVTNRRPFYNQLCVGLVLAANIKLQVK